MRLALAFLIGALLVAVPGAAFRVVPLNYVENGGFEFFDEDEAFGWELAYGLARPSTHSAQGQFAIELEGSGIIRQRVDGPLITFPNSVPRWMPYEFSLSHHLVGVPGVPHEGIALFAWDRGDGPRFGQVEHFFAEDEYQRLTMYTEAPGDAIGALVHLEFAGPADFHMYIDDVRLTPLSATRPS